MESIESELKDRVQISVEDDRHLRATTDLPNAIENAANRGAAFERALGRELVHQTIRERIGEWDTELENVDAGVFQCERKLNRSRQIGIARADEGDERLFVLLPERNKTLVDSIWHRRCTLSSRLTLVPLSN